MRKFKTFGFLYTAPFKIKSMSKELTENEKIMAEIIALHIVREKQLTDALRDLVDECKKQDFECYSTGKRLIEEAEAVL